jgi:hypothetical protein
MNWQQLVPIGVVLGVAAIFVWRASSPKHGHGCNCGCAHADEPETRGLEPEKKPRQP